MHCKDCISWKTYVYTWPAGICHNPMVHDKDGREKGDGVLMDNGGYTGDLVTEPRFGCIHFYAREETDSKCRVNK